MAALYLAAVVRLRRRGDAWPGWRPASFVLGCAAAVVPAPGGTFTAHMVQHVALGMIAPLLLVTARPVTLLLRALPAGGARRTFVTMTRCAAVLVFPPVAAVLDVGGLWVLYRTDLFAAAHHSWLMSLHVFTAGVLFSSAVCGLDPLRHRASFTLRATTLIAAGAAHAVLAKSLWATPPPGTAFSPADLHTGAEVMYYGGDLAEIGLAVVIATGWYAASGRRLRRSAAPA
ncbi:cytochrome c oxidase assembly protein [Actinomadura sp. DC4]|uniref:cytochrome c oxidase assembly protein n=1 Tax=Actinomadura sp. DC4 TaxID=3055069 RepID=UPI0025AFDDC2|nr:cytochrome c oxidase assembly protein [Actinomadura sp. DC4]MDN3359240.1 cytochrome c oxidase assembly protein [Actinomadura sp. DC4]